MPEVNEVLAKTVSFQETAWACPSNELSVQSVLNDIRQAKYGGQTQHLRELLAQGDREQYSVDKKRLQVLRSVGHSRGDALLLA